MGHSMFKCLVVSDPDDTKMGKNEILSNQFKIMLMRKQIYYEETITGKPQLLYKLCYVQLLKKHQIQCKHVKNMSSFSTPQKPNSFDVVILTILAFQGKK